MAAKKTGREKKMQMEDERVNEAEDTTLRIICGQSITLDGTEEELTVQKRFVSVIPCHDQLQWTC